MNWVSFALRIGNCERSPSRIVSAGTFLVMRLHTFCACAFPIFRG